MYWIVILDRSVGIREASADAPSKDPRGLDVELTCGDLARELKSRRTFMSANGQQSECKNFLKVVALLFLLAALPSCGNSGNPNASRILTSISVTPATADAQTYTNGQVMFTATGTFNLPPLTGPLTFATPYAGQFVVVNPTNMTIANVVATGNSTITVQCVSGVAGNVLVTASANANNGTSTIVAGNAQLTCP